MIEGCRPAGAVKKGIKMATKKRIEQLDKLLAWERECRTPETKDLFNRQIAENLFLREIRNKLWLLENSRVDGDKIQASQVYMHRDTLIGLALSILTAIEESEV